MDTSIKNLGHIPPHGATSSLIFFWTPYEQNFIYFYAHMVQRHVIRSRNTHGICPYWLNPHGVTPLFFKPFVHMDF